MNASLPSPVCSAEPAPGFLAPFAILLGCVALAARPTVLPAAGAVLVAAGAIGALIPVPNRGATRPRSSVLGWIGVAAIGVAAFGAARVVAPPLPQPATWLAAAATVGAAGAEEIFFRRLVYGLLARWGDGLAIIGAAAAFGVVHIPAYGAHALPVDLAAGMLLGWQRWATGGWTAPAATHAAANILQLL
jgi:membrane protease YdiL (CAAX protease family)